MTEALELERAPVVVVSAMGRSGAPYATDTLLGLVGELPSDDRERDLLASRRGHLSGRRGARTARRRHQARAFTGAEAGIGTDGATAPRRSAEIHTGALAAAIAAGIVPVVCGFQGMSETGALTTLGRGGSDTTACALGVALEADEVEIYTDVDGVMTADPRTCDGAEVLEVIGADELFQMARHGSRVVHTPAAELALASGLSVRVRNTYSDHPGTRVADIAAYRPVERRNRGLAHKRHRALSGRDAGLRGHTRAHGGPDARLPRDGRRRGVARHVHAASGTLVFCVTDTGDAGRERRARPAGARLRRHCDLAKVTLVGAGMHGVPGVMARVAESLGDAGVNVLQTADSHTTISVLVPAEDAERAVTALHDGFGLGE